MLRGTSNGKGAACCLGHHGGHQEGRWDENGRSCARGAIFGRRVSRGNSGKEKVFSPQGWPAKGVSNHPWGGGPPTRTCTLAHAAWSGLRNHCAVVGMDRSASCAVCSNPLLPALACGPSCCGRGPFCGCGVVVCHVWHAARGGGDYVCADGRGANDALPQRNSAAPLPCCRHPVHCGHPGVIVKEALLAFARQRLGTSGPPAMCCLSPPIGRAEQQPPPGQWLAPPAR